MATKTEHTDVLTALFRSMLSTHHQSFVVFTYCEFKVDLESFEVDLE